MLFCFKFSHSSVQVDALSNTSSLLVSLFQCKCSALDFHPSIPNDQGSSQRHQSSKFSWWSFLKQIFIPSLWRTQPHSFLINPGDNSCHKICWILYLNAQCFSQISEWVLWHKLLQNHTKINLLSVNLLLRDRSSDSNTYLYPQSYIHWFSKYLLSSYYYTKHGMLDEGSKWYWAWLFHLVSYVAECQMGRWTWVR